MTDQLGSGDSRGMEYRQIEMDQTKISKPVQSLTRILPLATAYMGDSDDCNQR